MTDNFEIDLGYDVADAKRSEGSELVPAGQHLVEIERLTKMDGNAERGTGASLLISFRIVDTEKPEHQAFVGAQFLDAISLKESVKWKVASFLDAVYGRQATGRKIESNAVVGKRIMVRTVTEKYEGVERTQVNRYMPASKWRKAPTNGVSTTAPVSDEDEVSI